MKVRLLTFIFLIFSLAALASGQTGTPQPTPPPTPQPTPQATPIQTVSMLDRMKMRRDAAAQLSPAEQARYRNMIAARYIDPIYRKPTRDELVAVAVDPTITAKYAAFLDTPNTGGFKLVRDNGCDQKTSVVSATDVCRTYSMPGAGNSFSFRTGNYRLRRLGDLSSRDGSFFVPGVFMHGILTVLGDIDPNGIGLESPGVASLAALSPATSTGKATEFGATIARGFQKDGHRFSATVKMKVNTTYALRSIAYRGKVMRAVVGATYNEMERDKRRDVIVIFRVVDLDADGAATIIWRELRNTESPELKNEK